MTRRSLLASLVAAPLAKLWPKENYYRVLRMVRVDLIDVKWNFYPAQKKFFDSTDAKMTAWPGGLGTISHGDFRMPFKIRDQ